MLMQGSRTNHRQRVHLPYADKHGAAPASAKDGALGVRAVDPAALDDAPAELALYARAS